MYVGFAIKRYHANSKDIKIVDGFRFWQNGPHYLLWQFHRWDKNYTWVECITESQVFPKADYDIKQNKISWEM